MWGVASGILTSAIIFICGLVSGKIVIPWYQDLKYEGIDIGDVWIYEWSYEGAKYRIQAELKQSAHTLKGHATLIKTGSADRDYVQTFVVNGSTWEGYVNLNLKSDNRKSLSFASALLRIKDRGALMEGKWSYRSATTEEVESESISLRRLKQ